MRFYGIHQALIAVGTASTNRKYMGRGSKTHSAKAAAAVTLTVIIPKYFFANAWLSHGVLYSTVESRTVTLTHQDIKLIL